MSYYSNYIQINSRGISVLSRAIYELINDYILQIKCIFIKKKEFISKLRVYLN